MSQSFEVFTDHENRVLLVRGELDPSTAPVLAKHLEEAIDGGDSDLLIDMSECGFIDTAGVNVLVASAKRLAGMNGGQLTLVHPTSQARRVLDLIGLRYSVDGTDGDQGLAS